MNGRSGLRNIIAVARRELVTRASTRSFLFSTLFLVLAAALVGIAPVVIGYFDRTLTSTVEVYVGASDVRGSPVATLDAMLNANPSDAATGTGSAGEKKDYTVELANSVDTGRQRVRDGKADVLLDVERGSGGDLAFTIYTKNTTSSRTASLVSQATASIAIADRLGRAGLSAAQQTQLFAPPDVTTRAADPAEESTIRKGVAAEVTSLAVTFGLVLFLFLAVILYGNWVAMSVVEEKTNRVMEIVLAAATPYQLLAGKVLGVGAAALIQYAAVLAAALAAIVLQGQAARVVLGESASLELPQGLTPGILLAFSAYFVLGFLLYAVLFAAGGSLVSRQEDVNSIVGPLTLVSTVGYLIALYASIGILDPSAAWVIVLSWVPFLSPYMMLGRLTAPSPPGPLEVGATIVLLAVTIVGAVWAAARIYEAGVLMYGQRPGLRAMWKAFREAR